MIKTFIGLCASILSPSKQISTVPTGYQNMRVMERYIPEGDYLVDGQSVKIRYLKSMLPMGGKVETAYVVMEIAGKPVFFEAPNHANTFGPSFAQFEISEDQDAHDLYVSAYSHGNQGGIQMTTIRFHFADNDRLAHMVFTQRRSAYKTILNPEGVETTRIAGQVSEGVLK